MATAYSGATSGFIWDTEASGRMVIDFSRNPKDFPVNKYTQICPAKKVAGKYTRFLREEAGRLEVSTVNDVLWADGNIAPEGRLDEKREYVNFECLRRTYPYVAGNILVENADYDVMRQRERLAAELAMRARTQLVYNTLVTTGSWDATHILDVTDGTQIPGTLGAWDESTPSRQDIYRAVTYGVERLLADTLNGVKEDDLQLVMSSEAARRIGMSQEIVDYIKGSPQALAQIRGEMPGGYVRYKLPSKLYGVNLVVDDTYKVTTPRGDNTQSRSQIWSRSYAFLLARPGGLVALDGSAPFSTVVWFAYKELETFKKDDKDNERQLGRITDFGTSALVAPVTGIWFQNITA